MSDAELEKTEPKDVWVDIYEAAERTGYSVDGMRKVAQRIGRLPEEQREIKMRKRTSRWELWLPDVIAYVERPFRGPHSKRPPE
ncbi:MAG: hypothetical protein ABI690_14465 [Chloroflexota bacterium]